MSRFVPIFVALLVLPSCDDPLGPPDAATDAGTTSDAGPPPFAPDFYCPGQPGCETGSGTALQVGVAQIAITPEITPTTDVLVVDVNMNGEYDFGDGDMFDDRDGVTGYQGIWMAGFGNARGATGVNDEQWVRAIALESGETTIVLLAIDLLGWFRNELELVREAVSDLGVDFVVSSATHSHQARDVIGIYGFQPDQTGRDDVYNALVRTRAEQAVREAVADLRAANVQYASVDLRDVNGGVRRYINDIRDPWVVDPMVRIMRFVEAGSTTNTIATVVNFGAHAEYLNDENTLLSSDFPHWLREGIENGVMGPGGSMTAGVGGMAMFIQGAIGSQIGPSRADVSEWDGTPIPRSDELEYATAMGEQIAHYVLTALADGGGSTTEMTADLAFRSRSFLVDVQNIGFHVAILLGLFDRPGVNWDPEQALIPGENEPDIRTEVSVIDIGRVQIITVPGELDPVLFLGGYDGELTHPGVPIVDETRTNPPDLTAAPAGPYLIDRARADADQVWLFGLTNDFLGYLVPGYDYELHETNPYLDEAPGDHYEETNSVGIDGWARIERELTELLMWTPP